MCLGDRGISRHYWVYASQNETRMRALRERSGTATARRVLHYVSGLSLPFEISGPGALVLRDRQNHLAPLNNTTTSFRTCIRIWECNCFGRLAYTYHFNN